MACRSRSLFWGLSSVEERMHAHQDGPHACMPSHGGINIDAAQCGFSEACIGGTEKCQRCYFTQSGVSSCLSLSTLIKTVVGYFLSVDDHPDC